MTKFLTENLDDKARHTMRRIPTHPININKIIVRHIPTEIGNFNHRLFHESTIYMVQRQESKTLKQFFKISDKSIM